MEKAATHLVHQGQIPDPELLGHTSPLGWEHIILTGDYDWHSGALSAKSRAHCISINAMHKRWPDAPECAMLPLYTLQSLNTWHTNSLHLLTEPF